MRIVGTTWNSYFQKYIRVFKRPAALAVVLIAILAMPSAVRAGQPDIEGWHNLPTASWSGGTTLQQSNSQYAEGDSIPFHYTVEKGRPDGLTGGEVYRVILKWEHLMDNGDPVEAFIDYLTSYNATENSVTGNAFDGLTCVTQSTTQIPADAGIDEAAGVVLPPAALNPGASELFDLCNVTVIGFSEYVNEHSSGNRIVRTLEVTYQVNGSDDQDIGIAFGGHLAAGTYWGVGNGAGNFPGASPQVLINQSEACILAVLGDPNNATDWICTENRSDKNININSNAILVPSTIIVEKQTDPDTAPDLFTFTGDVAGTIGNGGQIVVTGLSAGTYTSVEDSASDWTLASIVCDDDNSTGDVPNRTATFVVEEGETITCKFTNERSHLAVTIGYFLATENDNTVHFTWQTATESGTAGFNLLAESDGDLVQLNTELIPSKVIDSVESTDYSYEATSTATVFYLEEIEVSGKTDRVGPFVLGTPSGVHTGVSAQSTHVVWLPMIIK